MDEASLLDPSVFVNEIWKSVKGYEGIYEVSSFGRIRRMAGSFRTKRTLVLVPIVGANGYAFNNLSKNGKNNLQYSHRIAAAAFFGPSQREVNHIDGIKINNRIENLEYVTTHQNNDHAIRTGLKWDYGERNSAAKLTDEMVREIRKKYVKGVYGYKRLAKEYGVCDGGIVKVVRGLIWKHVK